MQTNRSKRYRAAAQQLDRTKSYSLADSVVTLKKFPPTKFDQTVTLSFRLGVDPKQSDQMVRGTCPLPHGSGKQVRVLVFAEGEAAKAAKEANAESKDRDSYGRYRQSGARGEGWPRRIQARQEWQRRGPGRKILL